LSSALSPFVSSEVETPIDETPSPMGISTALDANGPRSQSAAIGRFFTLVIPGLTRDPAFFDAPTDFDIKRDPGSSPG
jgi:cytochrome P450